MLKSWLVHPLTKNLDIDDPRTTHLRRRIIQGKPFLRLVYQEWYESIALRVPPGKGPVLEVGSGAGFMADFVSNLITSEIFHCPNIGVVLDASQLTFAAKSLRAVVMTDVLHHIPVSRHFFAEAGRCVRPGGIMAMIEPWVTPWSNFVYTQFHHEPFHADAMEWELPKIGPLSGANGALPWIIFARDRHRFEQEFPYWKIELIEPTMPFRYLLSGGVSLRSLAPHWSFRFWLRLENALSRWNNQLAMFALIVARRLE